MNEVKHAPPPPREEGGDFQSTKNKRKGQLNLP